VAGIARSQVLIAEHITAPGFTEAFVCPAGYVTLVKSVSITQNAGESGVRAALFVGNGAVGLSIVYDGVAAEGAGVFAEVWAVLNPGDFVYAYCNSNNAVAWVSGAVLAGPPQFPPGGAALTDLLTTDQLPPNHGQ
jgi:hypothetical protein